MVEHVASKKPDIFLRRPKMEVKGEWILEYFILSTWKVMVYQRFVHKLFMWPPVGQKKNPKTFTCFTEWVRQVRLPSVQGCHCCEVNDREVVCVCTGLTRCFKDERIYCWAVWRYDAFYEKVTIKWLLSQVCTPSLSLNLWIAFVNVCWSNILQWIWANVFKTSIMQFNSVLVPLNLYFTFVFFYRWLLYFEWQQVLDHKWTRCRCPHCLCKDRSWGLSKRHHSFHCWKGKSSNDVFSSASRFTCWGHGGLRVLVCSGDQPCILLKEYDSELCLRNKNHSNSQKWLCLCTYLRVSCRECQVSLQHRSSTSLAWEDPTPVSWSLKTAKSQVCV